MSDRRPGMAFARESPSRDADPVARFLGRATLGGLPDLESFLADEPPLEPDGLAAVLRADQAQRWAHGDRVPVEWYLDRHPGIADDPELALDLIHGEYLLREELGEPAELDAFLARFPASAETLRIQIAFHRALESAAGRPKAPGPDRAAESPYLPRIPGYQILGRLGSGGMGVIYRAHQIGLKRQVALKVVQSGALADAEHRARFSAEAEAAASLNHPNIVEIHEIGDFGGCPYFSLELVEGADLAHEIGGRPLPPRRSAEILLTLARAMHYAHGRGVVHRDLKPANVLMTAEGVPKIVDFGLAKRLDKDSGETESGTILGSPCYMSPEQAGGHARDVGPRSDVYSLGAILYEMLTGTPPFRSGSPLETLRMIEGEEPVRPGKLHPRVPRDLERICLKCLEKAPARRYGSAEDLAADLERFLNHEPVLARPVAPLERLYRWCVRRTSLAVAILLATLAILAAIGLSISLAVYQYLAAVRIGEALRQVQARQRLVDQVTARLSYEHGQNLCEQGDVGHGLLWFVHGLKDAEQARDADLERAFLWNLAAWRRRLHPLRFHWEHSGMIQSVAYRPDGLLVATAGDDRRVRLWDATTGRPIGHGLPHPGKVGAVAFSPDGRTLVTGGEDAIGRLWDVATASPTGVKFPHETSLMAVAFSPDGRTVATGSCDFTARLWDAATGEPIGAPMRHAYYVASVAFSPDGRTLITGSWDRTARLWDAATGEPASEPLVHKEWVSSVAFHPDGRSFVTGCYDQVARIWDRATLEPIGRPLQHQHCIRAVAFSPDGETVATGCIDGTARLWEVKTGRSLGSILHHQHSVSSVAFSPDGRSVVTGGWDRVALAWDIAHDPDVALPHAGNVRAVLFSPDGRTILSASQDKTARLWDAATGRPIGTPLDHDASVEAIAFSPDGRFALTGSEDRTARLWDAATGQPIGPPMRHDDKVVAVAFRPDGRAVLTGSEDRTARLWDAATGRPIGMPLVHGDFVVAVAFSPDGRLAVTASLDRTARLWDAITGRAVGEPLTHEGPVLSVAFSPDSQQIVTGSEDMTARLWDAASGRPLGPPLKHQGPVTLAVFSPDGESVITGGWDRVARVWDARTGLPQAEPLRHEGRLRALAISRDGRKILTGSYDRSAQLWDKATGRPIGPARRHPSQVWFVAISPDGRMALSGGQEHAAHLWNIAEPLGPPIADLGREIRAATGMALEADGSLKILDFDAWNEVRSAGNGPNSAGFGPPRPWSLDARAGSAYNAD